MDKDEATRERIASLREESNPKSGIYLRFRGRLMFPIRNDYGDVIAFSGRQLREDPNSGKYINSPETPLFEKSRVLFALDDLVRVRSCRFARPGTGFASDMHDLPPSVRSVRRAAGLLVALEVGGDGRQGRVCR